MKTGTFEVVEQNEMMAVNGGRKRGAGHTVATTGLSLAGTALSTAAAGTTAAAVGIGATAISCTAGLIYIPYKYASRDVPKRSHHR